MRRLFITIRQSIFFPFFLTIGFFVGLWFFDQLPVSSFFGSYVLYYGTSIIGSLCFAWWYSHHPWILKHEQKITRWFGIAALVYACCIVWTSCISYANYSEYIDLSYYHIFLQQLASFHLPLIWDTGMPVWSQHLSPFLFLFVPFYWIGAHAGFLVFVQALLAVSAVIPLYLFTKKITGSPFIAVCMSWVYLLFGGIQSSIYYGFHEVTFFPLMLFLVCLAWRYKKYWLFVLSLILMVFVKEEIAFIAIFLGLFLVCLRQWKYGITAIIVGILWYVGAFHVISYFHHGGYEYWGQFAGGSGGVGSIIRFALSHPIQFLQTLINDYRKPLMLVEVFGSFGFLPVFFPCTWLLLIPPLAMKLLSGDITMMNSFHYSATITGVMVIATVFSLVSLKQKKHRILASWFLIGMAVCANIGYGMYFYYSTYPKMTAHTVSLDNFFVHEDAQKRTDMLRTIPSGSVSCQYQLCEHVSRGYGMIFPIPGTPTLDYMVVDSSLSEPLQTDEDMQKFFMTSVVGKYKIINQEGTLLILQKIQQ